jgi:3-oxoacyl-[acyl-carrier-protein] synthase III
MHAFTGRMWPTKVAGSDPNAEIQGVANHNLGSTDGFNHCLNHSTCHTNLSLRDSFMRYRYEKVCLEAFGYTLPNEVVTSDEIERRLEPLYRRLRLPPGRLELMSGIRERRFWPADTLPSQISAVSAEKAIVAAGIDRRHVGVLVHGSVCRDFLEPATACSVHHHLELRPDCMVFDLSNACLGLLNGLVMVANMIELGQIRAGIVVGTEGGRGLVENTIRSLNDDRSLTRKTVKLAVASLTIGSASCAMVLCDRELSRTGNRIQGATAYANTRFHDLCRGGEEVAAGGDVAPLMRTDSERLMHEGIATGVITFERFLANAGWTRDNISKTFCHQVGSAHHKMMFEALELQRSLDFTTLEWLGNTGACALPVTMAVGAERGHLEKGDRVAMLGIGSGINSLMIGVDWQVSLLGPTQDRERGDRVKAAYRTATAQHP